MNIPTHAEAYQVLLLQAADEGRGHVLFGESQARARELAQPFVVGERFPDVYFEHPLAGDPFLDVTVLYGKLEPGTRVDSPLAGDHGALFDWYVGARDDADVNNINIGFELDTKDPAVSETALHFQPRQHTDLVRPFFEVIGEAAWADLYLERCGRMPAGWPISFCGLFRGRPGAPLRVCGYLGNDQKESCAENPELLSHAFDEMGFTAYDEAMVSQVSALMGAAPGAVDFQLDVYPDGHLGDTFAIDLQFGIEQPEAVMRAFEQGGGARVMELLEGWGAADERWHLGAQAAFARALPVRLPDGSWDRYAFTLMPQWAKARWTGGALQPAKLYHLGSGGLVDSATRERESG